MSYYRMLGLEREPFSTSPDPDFFYLTKEHETALTNILIETRLKRGLSVVLGDVGTGKTTLSRKLIQELRSRTDILFHSILNPTFENEKVFLSYLLKNFEIDGQYQDTDEALIQLRERFESFLYEQGVRQGKTVVLIIDECQKLSQATLEQLRVFLNYETNEFKLLQLILLGQLEFLDHLEGMQNMYDRISFKSMLNALDLEETRALILFRLRQAGLRKEWLFSEDAFRQIHMHAHGYPRQIMMLCHKALKALIMKNRCAVDAALINELVETDKQTDWLQKRIPAFPHAGVRAFDMQDVAGG